MVLVAVVVIVVVVLVLGVVLVAVVVIVVVVLGVVLVAVVVVLVAAVDNPLNPLACIDYQHLGIGRVEILDPRLEPDAVGHDHIGRLHPLNVAKRRLPVVRLNAAGDQHGHIGAVAADGPGKLVHGVERCKHDKALVAGCRGGAAVDAVVAAGSLRRLLAHGRGGAVDAAVAAGSLRRLLAAHAGGARQCNCCRNCYGGRRNCHRCHQHRALAHGRPATGLLINLLGAINF